MYTYIYINNIYIQTYIYTDIYIYRHTDICIYIHIYIYHLLHLFKHLRPHVQLRSRPKLGCHRAASLCSGAAQIEHIKALGKKFFGHFREVFKELPSRSSHGLRRNQRNIFSWIVKKTSNNMDTGYSDYCGFWMEF